MPNTTRFDVPVPRPVPLPDPSSRRWIDLILITTGGALVVQGLMVLGLPLLLVGLLMPVLQWRARRSGGIGHLLRLVPPELADVHQRVMVAAARPGTVDPDAVITAADELVLEVAAVLGGRPARRASQRRFVAVRLSALKAVVADLTERHEAWRAAMDELDALIPVEPARASAEDATGPGWLSMLLLVLLAPAFLLVDVARGAVRLSVALVEGIALRLRTVADLAVAGLRAVGRAIARALASWRALVTAVRLAVRTARGRFVSARTLALRRLRRSPRGLGRRPL